LPLKVILASTWCRSCTSYLVLWSETWRCSRIASGP